VFLLLERMLANTIIASSTHPPQTIQIFFPLLIYTSIWGLRITTSAPDERFHISTQKIS
jgi:hypothetical protein